MPNRILKESICTSDNLDQLSPQEESFFFRLIVNCDDYGIMDARPKILLAKCYPLKLGTIKEGDINKWLKALIKAELCFLYEVAGRRYLKMTSWENHQQIRAHKSKYPKPDSDGYQLIADDINGNHMIADDYKCPRNPIQSNPNPNTNTTPNPNPKWSEQFHEFWKAYPLKMSKGPAEKAWMKLDHSSDLFDKILASIEIWKKSERWNDQGGKFIPYPASWLNAKGWEDEYTEAKPGKGKGQDEESREVYMPKGVE